MEIKDALSYLRMLAYRDDLSFRRIVNAPKRNLGKRRMAFRRIRGAAGLLPIPNAALVRPRTSPCCSATRARCPGIADRGSPSAARAACSEVLLAVLNESGEAMPALRGARSGWTIWPSEAGGL